jgi:2-polyprenyl-3-methyl-5-hydroxy-6-metoxy-1,4-benzoquinol methylase
MSGHDPDSLSRPSCRICGSVTRPAGVVGSSYSRRQYHLVSCPECGFAFIADPWLDFARIYDDSYYNGRGADPLVDYRFELEHPENTIRRYEWEGITMAVTELVGDLHGRRWLDYGCGNGGLVRHLRSRLGIAALGFEEGAIAAAARTSGIPLIDDAELAEEHGSFDVVTAIEVLEHVVDPVVDLRRIRQLLRPGGLLFLTTGNSEPYAARLSRWSYAQPDVHISLFTPHSLALALTKAGFRPECRSRGRGFNEILKFKVLKNLRVRRRSMLTDALPSQILGPIADRRTRLSEHPVGWAV